MDKLKQFMTNKGHVGGITHPATSLTKAGVGGAFFTVVVSGLVGIFHAVDGQNATIVTGAFHLAGLAIIAAAAISVADLLARAYVSGVEARYKSSSGSPPGTK